MAQRLAAIEARLDRLEQAGALVATEVSQTLSTRLQTLEKRHDALMNRTEGPEDMWPVKDAIGWIVFIVAALVIAWVIFIKEDPWDKYRKQTFYGADRAFTAATRAPGSIGKVTSEISQRSIS